MFSCCFGFLSESGMLLGQLVNNMDKLNTVSAIAIIIIIWDLLLRIQLENIGLFPALTAFPILTAFHNLLPMEQYCMYGIYFYGVSK